MISHLQALALIDTGIICFVLLRLPLFVKLVSVQ